MKKNVFWNIFGLGAPVIFAVLAIPFLLRNVGDEKFGFFMLACGLVGFSSILDLGIGRAITHQLSKSLLTESQVKVGDIFFTAERVAFISGFIGMFIVLSLIHLGLYKTLHYSTALENDIVYSGWLVASTMPLHVVSVMYRGVNEAYGNYKGINVIRVVLGVANFLLPSILSLISTNLTLLISTLFISRLIATVAYRALAVNQISSFLGAEDNKSSFNLSICKKLLGFGLWNTVSSILNTLMSQSDRFIIGSVISVVAVSIYSVPFEVVTKLLILPGAVTTVLFPKLTSTLSVNKLNGLKLFKSWFLSLTLFMIGVAFTFYFVLPEIMTVWLGASLSVDTVSIARIILIGIVPYTIGTMMVSLIHAFNRPDVTAISHIIQTPIYLLFTYWAIINYGIKGAAYSWVARVSVDAIMLLIWGVFIATKRHYGKINE